MNTEIDPSISNILSPNSMSILKNIKNIQSRMKDNDMLHKDYIYVYGTLAHEFSDFADKYTSIFTKVIRGENLHTVAAALYYKDKINRGEIDEESLSKLLADKYLNNVS